MFCCKQAAWRTVKQPVADEAIRYDKFTAQLNPEREARNADYRGTRSRGPTVEGRRSAEWSLSGTLYASGTLGTPPDIFELLTAVMGQEVITGGVSVVYNLVKDSETVFNGLSIHHFAEFFSFAVRDAIVNEFSFQIPGTGHIGFECSGQAAEVIKTGSSLVATGQTAGNVNVVVTIGEGVHYSVGSKIKIGGVGGHVVQTIVGDAMTVDPVVAAAQSIGDIIIPDEPTGTTTGDAIPITRGQHIIDGTAIKIISGNVKIVNNLSLRNKHYGSAVASGFVSGPVREISFETTIDLSKPNFKYFGGAIGLVQRDVQIDLGDVPGNIFQIDMNKSEYEVPSIENPEENEAELTLVGSALPMANEDEITVTQK